jgi:hypothetical protein
MAALGRSTRNLVITDILEMYELMGNMGNSYNPSLGGLVTVTKLTEISLRAPLAYIVCSICQCLLLSIHVASLHFKLSHEIVFIPTLTLSNVHRMHSTDVCFVERLHVEDSNFMPQSGRASNSCPCI